MGARDHLEKDFYGVLGVPKDATAAEIKKAYRKLARELHPDANPGDAAAEARFKEVSEAYDVLSDEGRRREYDEGRSLFGSGGFRAPGGAAAGGFPFDLGDLLGQARGSGSAGGSFGDVFGGLFGGNGRQTRQPRRGRDVETEVTLDFADAASGATVPLRLSTPGACPTCGGNGAAPGTAPQPCPVCRGAGLTTRNQGGFALSEPCAACRGRGRVVESPCPTCAGTGAATTERTLTVRIPAGVDDGQRIRLAGRGGPGDRGGPAGDLYVTVHVRPHPVFGRRGEHLTLTLPVTFPEAALGATVTVPTLEAPVTLKVPAGTASGRTLRVRGKGLPRRDGTSGDLLVTVEVAVPATLSREARAALDAYAAAQPDDPRAHLTALLEDASRGRTR